MADAARLLELAEAVADGRAVDWANEEGAAAADQRELVRQLHLIAGVANTHRSGDASAAIPEAPASWGTLDVHELIGRGSFGSVYRAWDRRLARHVALKLLHSDESPTDSESIEEGRLLAQVRHPHVITVHGADRFDCRLGIWMELVDGRTLKEIVTDQGPFGAQEATLIGLDVSNALAAVHRAGLVHGDIKAQNVMREAGGRTVLMDFGAGAERDTPAARRAGTPLYMAPEVLAGGPNDAKSDIYAVGVLLFYLVSGEYPVPGATRSQVQSAHVDGAPPRSLHDLRPNLPGWYVRVVERALARSPGERFRSAGELHAALSDGLQTTRTRTHWPIWAFAAVIVAVLAGWVWNREVGAPTTPKGIAVLPLSNLTGDSTQDYFAAGLSDVLVANLGRIKGLRIVPVARSALGGGDEARERALAGLNVDAVLEGSVQRTASAIRVAVRLVQRTPAASGTLLWSQIYEGPIADAFPVQGRIVLDLTRHLGVTLDERINRELQRYGPNEAVQDAYLRGRYLLETSNRNDLPKARAELERALALDPSYAPAHATLAVVFMTMGNYGMLGPEEVRERATAEATSAFTLDPMLSEAALAMADVKFRLEWAWAEADRAYTTAIELNPSDVRARSRYARYLAAAGRTSEAMAEARRAYALDPLSEEMHSLVGLMMYYERRYNDAIAFFSSRERGPSSNGHMGLGRAFAEAGRYPEAIGELEAAVRKSGNDPSIVAELGRVHAASGNPTKAREILSELEARRNGGSEYVAPQDLAYIHVALGEKEEALRLLNDAIAEHASRLLFLGVDPRVDRLRDDARFEALKARLGIPR